MDDISHFVRLSEKKTNKEKHPRKSRGNIAGRSKPGNGTHTQFGNSVGGSVPWDMREKETTWVFLAFRQPCYLLPRSLSVCFWRQTLSFLKLCPFPLSRRGVPNFSLCLRDLPWESRKNSLTLARVDTQVNLLRNFFTSQFQNEKVHFWKDLSRHRKVLNLGRLFEL